jgi:hypothetical protein
VILILSIICLSILCLSILSLSILSDSSFVENPLSTWFHSDWFHAPYEGAEKKVVSLFFACFFKFYLSKPLTSLSCALNAAFPGLKMWDTFAFDCYDFKVRPGTLRATGDKPGSAQTVKPQVSTDYLLLQFVYPTIQCNCSACNVPPDAGLQKRATFPH